MPDFNVECKTKKTIMNKHITVSLSFTALLLFTGCRKYLKEASQDELTPTTTTSINELLAKEGYPYVATAATASDGFSLCNYLPSHRHAWYAGT